MSQLPRTKEEILATGTMDPEMAAALKAKPIPPGSQYTIEFLKEINDAALPYHQNRLRKSRPETITETEHHVQLGGEPGPRTSRVLVCRRSDLAGTSPETRKCPLVVLFFGGGHCVGSPEMELPLARRLALEHDAVVVLPSYRLAPEHKFPASITDSWAVLELLAAEARHATPRVVLPPQCDPAGAGFVVGGTSAGANLAGSLAHLARDRGLAPALTGQMLVAGSYMSPKRVPARFWPRYLSRAQNRDAPLLDWELYQLFQVAFAPDEDDPLWAFFDQHHPDDAAATTDPADPSLRHGHLGLPPAYFQICGLDMSRDDGLIYESVLREECGIKTKTDLYNGFAHCWWTNFPEIPASHKREMDTSRGVGWLLGKNE
jgi:acetyl esterase/lipase